VHFDGNNRFCGPKRANKAWRYNVYFSGRPVTATIGPYFSRALRAVPFWAESMARSRGAGVEDGNPGAGLAIILG